MRAMLALRLGSTAYVWPTGIYLSRNLAQQLYAFLKYPVVIPVVLHESNAPRFGRGAIWLQNESLALGCQAIRRTSRGHVGAVSKDSVWTKRLAAAIRESRDRLSGQPQEGQHSAAARRDPGPTAPGEGHHSPVTCQATAVRRGLRKIEVTNLFQSSMPARFSGM